MSNKLYEENDIQNIANAIRNKNGTEDTYKVSQMSTAIDSIEVIEQATAEGENISLANTKAMPYSDYVVEGKSTQDGEPSPSNPSEIHSVADDVNLFDYDTYKQNLSSLVIIKNGFKTTNYQNFIDKDIDFLEKGETYILSVDIKKYGTNEGTGASGTIAIRDVTNNRNLGYYVNGSTFTIPNDSGTLRFFIYGANPPDNNNYYEFTNIKIQKGSVATPYSPYNQGTVTIKQRGTTESNNYTLQTEPLRSLPNGVKDTIEEEQHKKIEYLVFDGSDDEGWELWSGGTNTIGFKISNIANLKNIQSSSTENIVLSNYFNKKTNQDRLTGDDEEGFATAVGNLYFKINRTTVNSLAEWKTWLSTHNTEIIYELETEIIEPLTQNQATTMLDIIKTGSYEGTTNIYTDEDVKPTMKVEYYKKA